MSVVAMPAVIVVLLVSMVSGAISSSLISKSASFAPNIENDKEIRNVDSIIPREDGELPRSSDHTSQFDPQDNEAEVKSEQTQMAQDDLSLRIERLETDNSYLKSKLKSTISEYGEIKSQYHMLESNYTRVLENNSDLEELIAYYEERIVFHNGSASLLKNKLSESISPPYTFIKDREIFWVFKDYQGNTHTWSIPIDNYRSLIESPEPQHERILRSDNGKDYRVRENRLALIKILCRCSCGNCYQEPQQKY